MQPIRIAILYRMTSWSIVKLICKACSEKTTLYPESPDRRRRASGQERSFEQVNWGGGGQSLCVPVNTLLPRTKTRPHRITPRNLPHFLHPKSMSGLPKSNTLILDCQARATCGKFSGGWGTAFRIFPIRLRNVRIPFPDSSESKARLS